MATSGKVQNSRKPRSPARKDAVMKRFEATVEELPTALTHSSDPRALRLVEMMLDPAYASHSLAKLCERAGLNSIQLLDMFRRYKLDLAIIQAAKRLPQIMEGKAQDALPSEEYCRRCDGLGYVQGEAGPRTCPKCKGSRMTRRPGDDKALDMILKVTGATSPARHASVNVNVDSTFVVGEVFDISKIIRGSSPVLDAEVVGKGRPVLENMTDPDGEE